MNVLINYSKDFGGAEYCSLSLAQRFSRYSGDELYYCSYKSIPSENESVWIKKNIFLIFFLLKNFKKINCIFLVNTLSAVYAPFLKILGYRLVYLMHDDYSKQTKKRKFCYRIGQLFSDIVVFPCRYSLSSVEHIDGPNKIVAYNKFNIAPKSVSVPFVHKQVRVLNVGRVEENKNQRLTLEIAALLKEKLDLSTVNVVFLGSVTDECYKNSLLQFASEKQLIISFESCDKNDVGLYYSSADLVLHTSNIECLPSVLIESVLAGVLVFSTNVGGASEILPTEFILESKEVEVNANIIEKRLLALLASEDNRRDFRKEYTTLQTSIYNKFCSAANDKEIYELIQGGK